MLQQDESAAVATIRAAELYGVEVLAQGIQDNQQQRDALRGRGGQRQPADRPRQDVARVLRGPGPPGSLVDALKEFSERQINLTKIESRPTKQELGKYVFLVDLEGHRTDAQVAEAWRRCEGRPISSRCSAPTLASNAAAASREALSQEGMPDAGARGPRRRTSLSSTSGCPDSAIERVQLLDCLSSSACRKKSSSRSSTGTSSGRRRGAGKFLLISLESGHDAGRQLDARGPQPVVPARRKAAAKTCVALCR